MLKALASGLSGAIALTVLHETARQFIKDAPRVDVTGERGIAEMFDAANAQVPEKRDLYYLSLAGDVVSNSLMYSLISLGKPENAIVTGAAIGLAAGFGAAYLPEKIGLGKAPTNRTKQTAMMTVAWYAVGGLTAGATYQFLAESSDE